MPKRLILASASPRRRELLSLLRLPFEVMVSDVEEEDLLDEPPRAVAETLARRKTDAVVAQLSNSPGICVIGADTVVAVEAGSTTSLAKPRDADEARFMLRMLSGRTHTVYTGVALSWRPPLMGHVSPGGCYTSSRLVDTQVTFRELTDGMIDAYIATGEPFDKAGAYGIQGFASAFVEAVCGDYFNVVGLPVATVGKMLEEAGIQWWRGPEALA